MSPIKPLTGNAGDFSGIVLKAAARGDLQAIEHYLGINPAWLNQVGPHGRTMLWEAAYKGRTETVRALIEKGADVNPLGSYYTPMLVELSAIAVAREAGRSELVDLLNSHGADDDLYAACHRGDLNAVDAFLRKDPPAVNRPAREAEFHPRMGYHPIHYTAAGQQLSAARLLVGYGAEVAEHLPLLIDWSDGNRKLIRYLKEQAALQSKGKPKSPESPQATAPRESQASVPAIDRPDWMGFPLLVDACRGNHNAPDDPQRVRNLLERGANVNVRDHKQKTPLHRACQAGFVKITRLLLEHGADLETPDETGSTPIFDAALHGRAETLQQVLEAGANVHHQDRRGETPLFAAARKGWTESVQVLIAAGANISHSNHKGNTTADVVKRSRARAVDKSQLLALLR